MLLGNIIWYNYYYNKNYYYTSLMASFPGQLG